MKKKPLIAFVGGHHNSTLEVAKLVGKKGFSSIWIGNKFASRGDKSLSAEYQEVTRSKIKFLELKTGKFFRQTSVIEWIKIVFGFLQSLIYLVKYRPDLIFSSGGYLSVPVVITGWILRIPSITHEQTVVSGWANKAITPFVNKILLTHSSSLTNFPSKKTVVVGLPIRKELTSTKFTKKFVPKMIYITCGKQGSHIINQAVFPLIPKLVKKFTIIHQIGSVKLTRDLDRARRLKDKLGNNKNRYIFAPYFFSQDASTYLRSATLTISRAGAHTVYELMVLGKRSILIPISWVSHNEQLLNARLAQNNIGSLIIKEQELSSDSLQRAIEESISRPKFKAAPKPTTNASEKILKIITETVANS